MRKGVCGMWHPARLLILALLTAALAVPGPAEAQSGRSLFERLFAPLTKRPEPPAPVEKRSSTPTRKKVRNAPPAAAPPPPETVDKLDNARTILVIGDFTSGGLAEGLTAAFAESPGVRIVQRANGSSGLVRDDYYDWLAELPPMLDEISPSIVAVMIGANDRQDFRTTEPRLSLRSEGWDKEYESRAQKLAAIIAERGIPTVWIGQPPYSSTRMSSDMIAFNDTYRRVVEIASGFFVDIWDGFVDEKGAYVTSGPDMNGQPARLRAGDGINITRAGRRKIAFYAEKPLRKLLGDAANPDIAELGPGGLIVPTLDPTAAQRIDRTNPIALDDPELDGGMELLGATVELRDGETRMPGDELILDGTAPSPPTGRADDFRRR